MKRSSIAFLVTFASITILAGPAIAHDPPTLVEYLSGAEFTADSLSADQAATLEAIRSDPAAIDVRIGQAFPGAVLSARALSLDVPGPEGAGTEGTVSFHDLNIELRTDHDYSVYARDEASGSECSLVVLGSDVLGTIRRGADTFKVHPLGGGLTAVYRYDSSRLEMQSEDDIGAVGVKDPSYASPGDSNPTTASEDGVAVIDLLVAYTWQVRVEAGNADALIRLALDQANRIFANSLIRARVRLTYSYQTNYVQHDELYTDLDHLVTTDDGYMDEVHAVRDRHGADVVVLLRGRHNENHCSSTYNYSSYFGASLAFSVVGHNCIGNYSFARALGHNLGAGNDYNPPFENHNFSHGHAFCNDLGNWRTLMSWNRDRSCPVLQPYFSNPDVSLFGTPAGDEEVRNNARVINETAHIVANFREAPLSPHTIPLVTSADNSSQQGFVRIINRSAQAGKVRIHAIDDEGRRYGPVDLSLDAKQTRHFNSGDLEDGNPSKGLSGGVGDGTGNWRLELATELDIEILAYIRTPDGFLTSIHDVAAQADDGSMRFYVPIFNPARNSDQQSRLRLINPGDNTAEIEITGRDDQGDSPPEGSVRLTLPAGAAHLLTAEELEQGAADFSGQFGVGSGKWQLFVSADRPIQVMSLLRSPTGELTNLSP